MAAAPALPPRVTPPAPLEEGDARAGAKKGARDPECEAIRTLVEEYLKTKSSFDAPLAFLLLMLSLFVLIMALNLEKISLKEGLIAILIVSAISVLILLLDKLAERARLRRAGVPEDLAPLVRRCAEEYGEELRAEEG